MTTRILPPEEWARLLGTELEAAITCLPPETQVIVVEDGGRIVGCWAVMRYVHVEGLWIAPEYRKGAAVGRRLLGAMRRAARALGVGAVWTAAQTDDIRSLIAHYGGVRIPVDHYVLPLGRESRCQ